MSGSKTGMPVTGVKWRSKVSARDEEESLLQLLELEVGLQQVLVEIVLRLTHLLGVVAVVPGGDADPCALLVGDGLHVRHLLAHAGHGRLPHRLEELHGALRASWPWNPRAASARGSRSRAAWPVRREEPRISVMSFLLSWASPLSPRLTNIFHAFSRRSRLSAVGEEGLDARPRVDDDPLALLLLRLSQQRPAPNGRTGTGRRGRPRPRERASAPTRRRVGSARTWS